MRNKDKIKYVNIPTTRLSSYVSTRAATRRVPATNGYPLRTRAITRPGSRVPGGYSGYPPRINGYPLRYSPGICQRVLVRLSRRLHSLRGGDCIRNWHRTENSVYFGWVSIVKGYYDDIRCQVQSIRSISQKKQNIGRRHETYWYLICDLHSTL